MQTYECTHYVTFGIKEPLIIENTLTFVFVLFKTSNSNIIRKMSTDLKSSSFFSSGVRIQCNDTPRAKTMTLEGPIDAQVKQNNELCRARSSKYKHKRRYSRSSANLINTGRRRRDYLIAPYYPDENVSWGMK